MHIPQKSRVVRILPLIIFALLLIIGLWTIHMYATRPRSPQLPQPALKELGAHKQIALGNFAMSSYLKEKPFTDILTSQFDFALADNTPNWYFTDGGLRPSPTTYNFKQMDQVVKFAADHKMPVQAHHYV
jgi:GH35 family endo-1,4-beta-xylanase